MPRSWIVAIACLFTIAGALLFSAQSLSAQNIPPTGFVALFNGTDMAGWHGMGTFDIRKYAAMSDEERAAKLAADLTDMQAHWKVEDGELVNDGKGMYATTDKDYGDVEMLVDWKMLPLGDSGVYLRGTPQVQIWDYTPQSKSWERGASKGSGGLFNNNLGSPGRDPLVLADKPFDEWNNFRITLTGARTTVIFNDKLVVDHANWENYFDRPTPKLPDGPDYDPVRQAIHKAGNSANPLFATGPIQLQTHGSEIRWRNVFVREIPADEANGILAKDGDDGFETIFNGRDFTGWSGDTENYEIVDGAIVCKEKKGGNVFTSAEYGDFVVRLEFKLPPGGNNGLAIRYPGSGRPAYDGMCEIQVLDTEHPRYEKIDPRQAHGSVYGMIPAHRGYLRPVGEWNFQEVTVKGPTIKVELNGSPILEGDVSKVTDFMHGTDHPGLTRTTGHFGFAGHNEPVAFRNIRIKRLD
ncbi:MAG TPA: DUF1080 domain-containing protein [Pirellulales bacterium]|jgi:hypothetical protein|nr:DUF1080 domain-containing protein [Pirellulales bacterium]